MTEEIIVWSTRAVMRSYVVTTRTTTFHWTVSGAARYISWLIFSNALQMNLGVMVDGEKFRFQSFGPTLAFL